MEHLELSNQQQINITVEDIATVSMSPEKVVYVTTTDKVRCCKCNSIYWSYSIWDVSEFIKPNVFLCDSNLFGMKCGAIVVLEDRDQLNYLVTNFGYEVHITPNCSCESCSYINKQRRKTEMFEARKKEIGSLKESLDNVLYNLSENELSDLKQVINEHTRRVSDVEYKKQYNEFVDALQSGTIVEDRFDKLSVLSTKVVVSGAHRNVEATILVGRK